MARVLLHNEPLLSDSPHASSEWNTLFFWQNTGRLRAFGAWQRRHGSHNRGKVSLESGTPSELLQTPKVDPQDSCHHEAAQASHLTLRVSRSAKGLDVAVAHHSRQTEVLRELLLLQVRKPSLQLRSLPLALAKASICHQEVETQLEHRIIIMIECSVASGIGI